MSYQFESIFTEVEYNEDNGTMTMLFRNGAKYQYSNVTPDIVNGLADAESKSRYYNANIRGKYPTTKI